MYVNCIAFINQVKTGQFAHHSPILYDITAASNWNKLAQGMFKMY
jgi:serine/threonine-protein phosphatase 2A activator